MPIISRVVSIILRVGELIFAAVVAGIVGSYLHDFDKADAWPQARWIYTEVIAGLSILLALLWLLPFSSSFFTWPIDMLLSFAWLAAFGLLVNTLRRFDCGGIFEWGHITDRNICSRWKASEAFSFLSAIFWMVSALVGIWFTFRTRNRAVAGDAATPGHRRRWFGRHRV
ncbi:hypothetical protein LOZ12_001261 [Ophidiomyces ophidiicola]|uniref:Uncharacterized protein n=1 Tax=Ophidiomyces ophidiicola TaxID=1387563 RepID=A0ACB8V3B8_9EURO|nr:uncharacterized protein LOZ57_004137 [Ophidiomyces ophidiicola]KAI1907152.1 hypothetical protein LOZ61_006284 [Ophidiomyces ophidiicola]KAI1922262.1 hypothetical protein LOZ60_005832 [Ophidiomyces ophidiicola]KAI1935519.1 hypothetical protein LOZ62_005921 [Ophidiomyces ophidiicola]KAI1945451.1 hypothetical protein LOZ57_004137 [Ophidiomyces ophidiicola]KAI1950275.1 hypothetical protein LOZ59_005833 [Ophidiomyces ophidiicola]